MRMPQLGRTALVTGANSGVGYATACALARDGATVLMAGRDLSKLDAARAQILAQWPDARIRSTRLDLADLTSIEDTANQIIADGTPLDLLINNAGVMAIPTRQLTKDGFELTFGTNHLGHFALTGRLLPMLLRADQPRIVQVSALVARRKHIDLGDAQSEHDYRPMRAYAKSKLANVLFITELARRAEHTGLLPVVVHPGTSVTGLQRHGSRVSRALAGALLDRFIGHSIEQAALPSLYAATESGVEPGCFYAPTGRGELRGPPGKVPLPPIAHDATAAMNLWTLSEQLTGVRFSEL